MVLFLNEWADIMIVNHKTVNAPLPLGVEDVFMADSGDITARGGLIARQSLRINSVVLAQRPLVWTLQLCIAVRSSKRAPLLCTVADAHGH
jgi:hypothetical protein